MSTLELAVEELKTLPPAKQQQAALDAVFGCMSPEEADAFQRRIDEGCERIDA